MSRSKTRKTPTLKSAPGYILDLVRSGPGDGWSATQVTFERVDAIRVAGSRWRMTSDISFRRWHSCGLEATVSLRPQGFEATAPRRMAATVRALEGIKRRLERSGYRSAALGVDDCRGWELTLSALFSKPLPTRAAVENEIEALRKLASALSTSA